MKSFQLFFMLAVTVSISSCASVSSDPGVPTSVLDANSNLNHELKVGEKRFELNSRPLVVASVTVANFSQNEINHGNGIWFGEDLEGPRRRTYLKALKIVVEGHDVEFTRSMISPLVEPHWLGISMDGVKLYVTVDGLDAGDSYRAIFTVKGGLIVQRLIAHGEFTHEIWERTIYHDDFLEHPEKYKNM
jgi:hypothetical protein